MKTTDLMVGDWVLIPDHQDAPATIPARVTMVNDCNALTVFRDGGDCIFTGEEVEPIPLTKEILEKNKFPYAPKADGYFVGDLFLKGNDDIGYSVGVNIRIDNGDGIVSGMYYTFTKIHYVHELQHALKLCEIDKEIVL